MGLKILDSMSCTVGGLQGISEALPKDSSQTGFADLLRKLLAASVYILLQVARRNHKLGENWNLLGNGRRLYSPRVT